MLLITSLKDKKTDGFKLLLLNFNKPFLLYLLPVSPFLIASTGVNFLALPVQLKQNKSVNATINNDYTTLTIVNNESIYNVECNSKEEQETIRHGWLVYCELDTFAMVKIYEKLIEVTK